MEEARPKMTLLLQLRMFSNRVGAASHSFWRWKFGEEREKEKRKRREERGESSLFEMEE